MQRNTTIRDRHRRIIAADQPPCHICGGPIDYQAHHYDPYSFTVDHITPLHKGGPDTLDNKAAAHRACNRNKSDKVPSDSIFVTSRDWVADDPANMC